VAFFVYNIFMKLGDCARTVFIDPAKFVDYALNSAHPTGKHKAQVFLATLGYTAANYNSLVQQIADQALNAETILQRSDRFGEHLRVNLVVKGVKDQTAVIRTGWLVKTGEATAQLTTVYVLPGEKP